ncbi:condensation domain-containing protein, partial [Staphylococcus xylosus]|uniref:condensation domain-containing protein n=1 Tax=Staphylococcus xylosus TaxID=1288 RepID=UPI003F55EE40
MNKKSRVDTYYKVSPAQRKLWMTDQVINHPEAYNISGKIYINGRVSKSILERAINNIISRHETLRTRFEYDPEKNEVLQVLSDETKVTIHEYHK